LGEYMLQSADKHIIRYVISQDLRISSSQNLITDKTVTEATIKEENQK